MRVVIVANETLRQEMLAHPLRNNLDLQWIETPADYCYNYTEDACIDLLFENSAERIHWLKQFNSALIVVNSVITTLKEIKQDFIRINGWNTFLKRSLIEASCSGEQLKKDAEKLFASFAKTIEWVPDQPGFITPRIIASVINEAFMTLEEKVSNEREIDTAMKLGTNYPYGPFEWMEQIGVENIYELMNALEKEQARYKPSLLLKEKAHSL